jgi:hypothetical protein
MDPARNTNDIKNQIAPQILGLIRPLQHNLEN